MDLDELVQKQTPPRRRRSRAESASELFLTGIVAPRDRNNIYLTWLRPLGGTRVKPLITAYTNRQYLPFSVPRGALFHPI